MHNVCWFGCCRSKNMQEICRLRSALEAANADLAEAKAIIATAELCARNQTASITAANARIGELDDRGPGTIYARISSVCRFAEQRGLCSGIQAKPGELFLMESYDEAIARAERAEARIAAIENLEESSWKLFVGTVARAERVESECKALRALLTRWLECMGNFAPPRLIDDTRAALNPSPEVPKVDIMGALKASVQMDELTARAERAEAKCKALREALEFYANESSWHTPPHCPSVALLDCGYKARAALNPSPAET